MIKIKFKKIKVYKWMLKDNDFNQWEESACFYSEKEAATILLTEWDIIKKLDYTMQEVDEI